MNLLKTGPRIKTRCQQGREDVAHVYVNIPQFRDKTGDRKSMTSYDYIYSIPRSCRCIKIEIRLS